MSNTPILPPPRNPDFWAFVQREYRNDEGFSARDLSIAERAWDGAKAAIALNLDRTFEATPFDIAIGEYASAAWHHDQARMRDGYVNLLRLFQGEADATAGAPDLSLQPDPSWKGPGTSYAWLPDQAAPAPQRDAPAGGVPIELQGVTEALAEGDGIWRSCSGCHESNEGWPTGAFSRAMNCHLGNGCSECGGIGAIWDTTDYEEMASLADEHEPASPPLSAQPAAELKRFLHLAAVEGRIYDGVDAFDLYCTLYPTPQPQPSPEGKS